MSDIHPASSGAAGPLAVPERYGKYNLLEKIGTGGMAEIWRAKTLGMEGFTKDLVIKRILPRFSADEDFVRSFIDEARLVARLQHANIVQIFDFDRVSDTYYLAMELVDGKDLRQIQRAAAKAGSWPTISVCAYLIAEACKGLHYAHTKTEHGQPLRLVHRDISPHNILVSTAGDVKIADFGIAKVEARAGRTAIGMVKGKLSYMSPEQITGQPLDARTDIYSMGIVLWEMLTQRRLFSAPSEAEVVQRVRDGDVPAPRQINPQIPEALEALVMRMLVVDREARYQSAGEVARDLCSLPCYAYEAQELGDLVRRLFPTQNKNWTQMLQSVTDSLEIVSAPPSAAPVRSNMAGSDQKTQIAAQLPEEVLRLAGQAPSAAPPPQAAPPQAAQAPASLAPSQAKTMMAEAPKLPVQVPPQAAPSQAKTMMAEAPKLPLPPAQAAAAPGTPPALGGAMPAAVAPGGFAQGAPPPNWPPASQPVRSIGGNMNATVIAGAGGSINLPPAGRALAPPLPLHPFSSLSTAAAPAAAGSPLMMRFIGGPALALFFMAVTAILLSKFGSGNRGPSVFAAKNAVQIVTTPAGASVYVDGSLLSDKTPTSVKGDVETKAKIKLVLEGYEPYEVVLAFTRDERPPLNVNLFRKGKGPIKPKEEDKTAYDDKPGTQTKPPPEDPPEKDDQPSKDKVEDKVEVAKVEPKGKPKDPEDEETKPDTPKTEVKPEPAIEEKLDKRGKKRKDKPEVLAVKGAPLAKPMVSILVRPWAIVYVDNKKIKQTPIRDLPLSPGKHTLLLVNDTKGKRETIPLTVSAGENQTITRNWD